MQSLGLRKLGSRCVLQAWESSSAEDHRVRHHASEFDAEIRCGGGGKVPGKGNTPEHQQMLQATAAAAPSLNRSSRPVKLPRLARRWSLLATY
ncbi:hypothetical protein E4U19_000515 [Claviceps sp. Clav32 group G5]|nr:hypothetical protein E4U19_000515 [Claviceps sp. Clav32 group G5]